MTFLTFDSAFPLFFCIVSDDNPLYRTLWDHQCLAHVTLPDGTIENIMTVAEAQEFFKTSEAFAKLRAQHVDFLADQIAQAEQRIILLQGDAADALREADVLRDRIEYWKKHTYEQPTQ